MKHTKEGWVVLVKRGYLLGGKAVWTTHKHSHSYWFGSASLFHFKKDAQVVAKTYGRGNAKVVKAVQTTEWEE